MDFIERLFGLTPDGGDGSLEVVWLAAIAGSAILVILRRRLIRRASAKAGAR